MSQPSPWSPKRLDTNAKPLASSRWRSPSARTRSGLADEREAVTPDHLLLHSSPTWACHWPFGERMPPSPEYRANALWARRN